VSVEADGYGDDDRGCAVIPYRWGYRAFAVRPQIENGADGKRRQSLKIRFRERIQLARTVDTTAPNQAAIGAGHSADVSEIEDSRQCQNYRPNFRTHAGCGRSSSDSSGNWTEITPFAAVNFTGVEEPSSVTDFTPVRSFTLKMPPGQRGRMA